MGAVYDHAYIFKRKYPKTVTWRLKKHCAVIEKHLNLGENVEYVFVGQINDLWYDLFSSSVIAITNKRILIGQKRVLFGYKLNSITPDLFNDMQVYQGLMWGKITIDTVKEKVTITNLDKKCLDEIETEVSEKMMELKKDYGQQKEEQNR